MEGCGRMDSHVLCLSIRKRGCMLTCDFSLTCVFDSHSSACRHVLFTDMHDEVLIAC